MSQVGMRRQHTLPRRLSFGLDWKLKEVSRLAFLTEITCTSGAVFPRRKGPGCVSGARALDPAVLDA